MQLNINFLTEAIQTRIMDRLIQCNFYFKARTVQTYLLHCRDKLPCIDVMIARAIYMYV